METKAINTKLKGHARVDVADVLRGLAVMGIICLLYTSPSPRD